MKTIKYILIVVLLLSGARFAFAAPEVIYQPTLLPDRTDYFELGTTSLRWLNIFGKNGFFENITVTGTCTGCGGGAGSSGGTWSTTTSTVSGRLINYPNNDTDIVSIGSNSTTTSEFWFDPNTSFGALTGALGVGTTSPSTFKLDVYGSNSSGLRVMSTDTPGDFSGAGIQGVMRSTPTAADQRLGFYTLGSFIGSSQTNGVGIAGFSEQAWGAGAAGSYLTLETTASGGTTRTEKVRVTGSGNVGVGTTSPYAKLSVVGQTVSEYFTATSTTATSTFIGASVFGTGVSGTTKVLVGTTSPNTSSAANLVIANDTGAVPYLTAIRNSSNAADFTIGAFGITSIRGPSLGASLNISTASTNVQGAIIKGTSGQTADLQQWQDSLATVLVNVTAGGNLGIGTSTPGTLLSLGNTGNNTINISPTATSTFGSGINLRSGCFAIAGTCISGAGGGGSGTVNSGSQYQTAFYASNGTSVSGTSTLILRDEKVGIGTTSPYAKLSVAGEVVGQYFTATSTTASSTFPLLESGRALFGDARPNYTDSSVKAEVWGNTNGAVQFGVGNKSNGTAAYNCIFQNNDAANKDITAYAAMCLNSSQYNDTTFGTAMATPYQWSIENSMTSIANFVSTTSSLGTFDVYTQGRNNENLKLRVTNAGNVGIGTSSPYAKLSVVGPVVSEYFAATSTTATSTFANAATIGSGSARFTVDYSGNVGVATSTPWKTLSVVGTMAINGLTTSTAGNAVCILANFEVVTAGNTTCTTSSKKTKNSIQDISYTEAERLILSLESKSFKYNESNEERLGFIAEEVSELDPRLVEYAKEDIRLFDGQVIHKGEPVSVQYANITSPLVKVVQELVKDKAVAAKKSAEDNWQWVFISILIVGMIYQQTQIIRLKKK